MAENDADLVAEFDRIVAGDCIVDDVSRHQEVIAAIRKRLRAGLAVPDAAQQAELAAKRCLQEVERTERRLVWTRERQNALAGIILEHFGPDAVRQARRDTADLIPDSWLDPLLSGPEAVIGKPPYSCRHIERLLQAVKKRVETEGKEGNE